MKNLEKWTREQEMLITIHKTLYQRDDIDRLYVSRKERERPLTGIEDSMDASVQEPEDYIEKSK